MRFCNNAVFRKLRRRIKGHMITDLNKLIDFIRQIGCLKHMVFAVKKQMRKLRFIR